MPKMFNQQNLTRKFEEADKELLKLLNQSLDELKKAIEGNLAAAKKPKLSEVEISKRIEEIIGILTKPVDNLKSSEEPQKKLSELMKLHYSMQPGLSGKLAKSGLFYSPREHMKRLLNLNQNIRETIDPMIRRYQEAQREYITNYVSYLNAIQQCKRIDKIRNQFPNQKVELILLKRHEVCSNLNKGFGLNPDTGLDALHLADFGKQTTFELGASQSVQSKQLALMKESGGISHVQLIVSPVTRAYETAIHATYTSDLPDSIIIDNHFAEKQMNTVIVSSGRASRYASSVADDFKGKNYKNVGHMEDFLIPIESETDFLKRVSIAFQRMTKPYSKDQESVEMRVIVGHGAMNKALISLLNKTIKIEDIPEELELDFGSHYEIIVVRDEQNNIKHVAFGGCYSRFGSFNGAPMQSVEDELEEKTSMGPQSH